MQNVRFDKYDQTTLRTNEYNRTIWSEMLSDISAAAHNLTNYYKHYNSPHTLHITQLQPTGARHCWCRRASSRCCCSVSLCIWIRHWIGSGRCLTVCTIRRCSRWLLTIVRTVVGITSRITWWHAVVRLSVPASGVTIA